MARPRLSSTAVRVLVSQWQPVPPPRSRPRRPRLPDTRVQQLLGQWATVWRFTRLARTPSLQAAVQSVLPQKSIVGTTPQDIANQSGVILLIITTRAPGSFDCSRYVPVSSSSDPRYVLVERSERTQTYTALQRETDGMNVFRHADLPVKFKTACRL